LAVLLIAASAITSGVVAPASGQGLGQGLGPVTGLQMPRYVSVKKKARARKGPSTKHSIDWVYVHLNTPVRVVQEYGHWRRVEDREGFGGWIHYALLSNSRFVVFTHDMHEIRYKPSNAGKAMARVEAGVIARLLSCEPKWCRVEAGAHSGWTEKSGIWGVTDSETFD
jgi:SH3-like domain-containing protein